MDGMVTEPAEVFGGLLLVFGGLSAGVQIAQQFYKYLTSSKERAYRKALEDFLGPWVRRALDSGALLDLQVRGPLQFLRVRPRGALAPMSKQDLLLALERTLPRWTKKALDCLEQAAEEHRNGDAPDAAEAGSSELGDLTAELAHVEPSSPDYWNAQEVLAHLRQSGAGKESNPGAAVERFRRRFCPHLMPVARHYDQFMDNFLRASKRRNLRQTFTLALVVAAAFDLPFHEVYGIAAGAGGEVPATELRLQTGGFSSGSGADPSAQGDDGVPTESVNYLLDSAELGRLRNAGWPERLRFVFGCVLTAALVSFGAPVLHDLSRRAIPPEARA
jgi:hypothetical protein